MKVQKLQCSVVMGSWGGAGQGQVPMPWLHHQGSHLNLSWFSCWTHFWHLIYPKVESDSQVKFPMLDWLVLAYLSVRRWVFQNSASITGESGKMIFSLLWSENASFRTFCLLKLCAVWLASVISNSLGPCPTTQHGLSICPPRGFSGQEYWNGL